MSNSQLAFPDLTIQGYRGFRDLKIPDLGRVTLITGKNNTGKSSILEALRLVSQKAAPNVLYDILVSRSDFLRYEEKDARFFVSEGEFYPWVLFHGFPSFDEEFKPIVIKTGNSDHPMKVSLSTDWQSGPLDKQHRAKSMGQSLSERERALSELVLVTSTEEGEYVMSLEEIEHFGNRWVRSDRDRMNCRIVHADGVSDNLGTLWDRVVLRDEEEDVVRALQTIVPDITAVRMIGGGGHRRLGKAPYVRIHGLSRYVPLRSLGDGVNRMLTLILSLLDARDGLLLIDEFENGLYYAVQLEAWRMIFRLAQRHNIQVFTTTHSWDAVEAFQTAAAETPEVGVLLRLTRKGGDIIPTVFTEDDLQVIARQRIEVR
ncbi:MAG: ATP-binding protein [Caldilineaceae bacterium SB0662_bin_9]|uniref:ATP-binding protein n=1 Tax=Caldilineaceae bacterium SB0662_bin_9 TaxID=2605258 RepID=A0A6B1DV10_9CHLR|nr:ATP-binding protein [Caldilineaceae bacterium SB0662_bin_9]